MKKYMEKIIGILIVLFVVGTTMQSCSEDSKEEENFLQKIDPVEQLEVLNTNREKELVVNFVRKTYVKDLQIEIAYRRIDTGKTQEWSIVLLNVMMSNTKTEQIICYKYLQRERMR